MNPILLLTALAATFILVSAPAPAQLTNFTLVHTFGLDDRLGDSPHATVIEGSDGALYGTTTGRGLDGAGTIFRVNKDGTGYRRLYQFGLAFGGGSYPYAPLLEGSDGNLYGAASQGGENPDFGAVFKIHKDGSGYRVLRSFKVNSPEPGWFHSALIEGSDHLLYGAAEEGSMGSIFRINLDGSGYAVLHTFKFPRDAVVNSFELCEGSDGWLYGTASGQPWSLDGIVYKIRKDGSDYSVLHRFDDIDPLAGLGIFSGLIEGQDGALYGTIIVNGPGEHGFIFKIQRDGSGYTVVRSFDRSAPDFANGPRGVQQGPDGWLYGIASRDDDTAHSGLLYRVWPDGSQFTVLHTLPGTSFNRVFAPRSGGEFVYGTTQTGGTSDNGTVFKIGTDGVGYTSLVSFQVTGGDANLPESLLEGADGRLYGLSQGGGTNNAGTFFKVNRDGSDYSILRHFGDDSDAGSHPSDLISDGAGVFYGVTRTNGSAGGGTVFRVNRDGGDFRVLRSVPGGSAQAVALVLGADGILYGMDLGPASLGVVFGMETNGANYRVLHTMMGAAGRDSQPLLLLQGRDGWLYGAYGTVLVDSSVAEAGIFKLSTNGTGYALLHNFRLDPLPAVSVNNLIEGSDGMLYGTTYGGGDVQGGILFKLGKDGDGFTILRSFQGNSHDDSNPFRGSLLEGADGALYGIFHFPFVAMFKVNKDGTGYQRVRTLPSGFLDPYNSPIFNPGDSCWPLLRTRDGVFYGATPLGGPFNAGTIFRFGHALGLERTPTQSHLKMTGLPGYTYTLERSTDLSNWTTLDTVTLPDAVPLNYEDVAPPAPGAFYRLRVP